MKLLSILWLNWITMVVIAGGFFILWAATGTELACSAWGISMVFVMAAYMAYCFERDL